MSTGSSTVTELQTMHDPCLRRAVVQDEVHVGTADLKRCAQFGGGVPAWDMTKPRGGLVVDIDDTQSAFLVEDVDGVWLRRLE
jgi:hypothetical protein